ncbi:MAG TPA: amidohydrolase family protein [Burkholderiales bacterium]|nr:amidohydrolase family protein [Burkholderiales bacterium]
MSGEFPIVDAHQHFWEPEVNYHPWLRDQPPIAFRYGDYSALRRRYLPADYFADAHRWNVVKTVYVETEWDPRDPVGEMRYVERLRRETGWPSVAVAQAWLEREDCAQLLERQAQFDFVRGIRHKPAPGQMNDARWRAGFARLARFGLRFELQAPWTQLAEAVRLAGDFPDTLIVLNHAGLPADRSRAGIDGWRRALAGLAACRNAVLKVSGLGRPGRPWTVDANREIVSTAIDLFGIERTMFASNFPVDGLCASFDDIVLGCREIVRGLAPHEQRQFFHDNAMRLYAME